MRVAPWPQSLFGRLLAASVLAVLAAQAAALFLIAQDRERFALQASVHEWTHRISDTTLMLQPLSPTDRAEAVAELSAVAPRDRRPHLVGSPPAGPEHGPPPERGFLRMPLLADFEQALREHLHAALGATYQVEVTATPVVPPPAIQLPVPFYEAHQLAEHQEDARRYDVKVRFPDGGTVLYRVTRMPGGAPLPRNLFLNLALLVLILVIVLYLTARNITRPLSELARAADSIGRDASRAQLEERGARELRDAARAFNTMQDRLHRYLDSRSRVLAAMSHDLKTPLTRLRLQVEALDNPPMEERIGHELDEMEAMVHEALSLFRGLDEGAPATAVDMNALLGRIRTEFADMRQHVSVSGQVLLPFVGKPHALKRCLTNLIVNAIKFGGRAEVVIEDGAQLVIRVRDNGPGIPAAELERVFEPFYRVESSRNRDSGGTGLGLTIARDIAQAHGGALTVHNRATGGLEAVLILPRRR
ncbi:MAG TPA: HAMP domain-containing sensor histidine kinase [Steroidobacteraceae bacterium]|jgi:signal transduction histidine kinase